jgi:hypothetical protein
MRDQYAVPAEYGSPTLLVESGIWHIWLLHAKCGGLEKYPSSLHRIGKSTYEL